MTDFEFVKDGGKSPLRRSGKFHVVGAQHNMQRMFDEKLVSNVIITSENHLYEKFRQRQVKKGKNRYRNTKVSLQYCTGDHSSRITFPSVTEMSSQKHLSSSSVRNKGVESA